MAKQVMQFRFYGSNSNNGKNIQNNQPSNISINRLTSGSLFTNYMPIIQLGIQALPGTKFYLNEALTPIVIGSTGIYEIDLNGLTEINKLRFSSDSLTAIDKNPTGYLIVDIIYEKGV